MELGVFSVNKLIDAFGEDKLSSLLQDFECKKDRKIEHFVKNLSIDFAKRKISTTFLVMDNTFNIYGMFSLTHKPIIVKKKNVSSKSERILKRYSSVSKDETYLISSFLIAQFAKNSNSLNYSAISGNRLLDQAIDRIIDAQNNIAGKMVYVDVKNIKKLINFYIDNGFIEFDKRYSEKDKIEYIQMMRFI